MNFNLSKANCNLQEMNYASTSAKIPLKPLFDICFSFALVFISFVFVKITETAVLPIFIVSLGTCFFIRENNY